MIKNALLIVGCVLGVIGAAAPSSVHMGGLPVDWSCAAVAAVLLLAAYFVRGGGAGHGEHGADGGAATPGLAASAREAILRTSDNVRGLIPVVETASIEDAAQRIQNIILQDINPVLSAQDALIAGQGFALYAAHTGPWAGGERMLYRAWSAATDGHRPEAVAALHEAIPYFEEAAREFPRS